MSNGQNLHSQLLKSIRFLVLHPQAMNPPDIRTSTAFLEWIGRGTCGRIEERPTVETVEDFRRHFQSAMKKYRHFEFSKAVTTTLKEVRVAKSTQLTEAPDLE